MHGNEASNRPKGTLTGIADAAMASGAGAFAADGASRQSAKGVLADLIHRKQRELDNLRALHAGLPDFAAIGALQADSALWQLISDARK